MARDKKTNVGRPHRPLWEIDSETRRRRHRRYAILALSFFFFVLFWLAVLDLAKAKTNEEILHDYVSHFFRQSKQKKKDKALKKIPFVIEQCNKQGIDPLLLACIISHESTWCETAIGKAGEIGLTQIMPNKYSRRFNLKTIEGQIEAGAIRLGEAFRKCGPDVKRALTHYASGKCVSDKERTKRKMTYRHNYYRRMQRRFAQ